MDAQQIKDLIDQKIAGQGTMVDVGGALPTILKAIVDMAGGALSAYVLEQDVPSGTAIEISSQVYSALKKSLAIYRNFGTEVHRFIPRCDALMFSAPNDSGEQNSLQQLIWQLCDDTDIADIDGVFVNGGYPYDETTGSGSFDVYVLGSDSQDEHYYLGHYAL